MSRTAKGIDTQKLFDTLAKSDLDDQIAFYYALKNYLNEKIVQRAKESEEETNRWYEIQEGINSPNGKEKDKNKAPA